VGSFFRLFVYGTLKRGGCRHGPLEWQRFLGPALTRPLYALYDLGDYPGLVPCGAGGQSIAGELYEVEAELRGVLDALEGSPDWFRLGPIELEAQGEAAAYFYQGATAGRPRLASGRWDRPGEPGA
jgi:gamma-glutamylcyclotransferase (GGCT)/AIG2-like uncharacterized protein YtfP